MSKKPPQLSWKRLIMKIAIAMLVAGGLVGGCSYINTKLGLEDDHFIEEILEHHIEEQTGLDIDLSHESPE